MTSPFVLMPKYSRKVSGSGAAVGGGAEVALASVGATCVGAALAATVGTFGSAVDGAAFACVGAGAVVGAFVGATGTAVADWGMTTGVDGAPHATTLLMNTMHTMLETKRSKIRFFLSG
jgi:hypothetical protein